MLTELVTSMSWVVLGSRVVHIQPTQSWIGSKVWGFQSLCFLGENSMITPADILPVISGDLGDTSFSRSTQTFNGTGKPIDSDSDK